MKHSDSQALIIRHKHQSVSKTDKRQVEVNPDHSPDATEAKEDCT